MRKETVWKISAVVLMTAWMIVIFSFSAQPDTESSEISGKVSYRLVQTANSLFHEGLSEQQMEHIAEEIDHPVRKAAHMTEYGILAVLVFHVLCAFQWKKGRFLNAVCITAAYACTDEFHQLFVSGRAGRLTDVMIDSAGACIALALVEFIIYVCKKMKKRKR